MQAGVRQLNWPSPPPTLSAFASVVASNRQQDAVARLSDRDEFLRLSGQTREDLSQVKEDLDWLAARAKEPVPNDVDLAWLADAVAEAEKKVRDVTLQFSPVIEKMNDLLEPPAALPPGIERLVRDGIAILQGWLEFYRGLHALLSMHLDERSGSATLRARPVEGEIDHEALSREFMARYPKLRAALAK
jgi:hypothetical protein